jgi:hypothetical protein
MKISRIFAVTTAFALSMNAYAGETLLQTVNGDKTEQGDRLEVKAEPKANSGKIARVHADLPQWGAVIYLLEKPIPAGKSIIRFRIYVDGQDTAKYSAYTLVNGDDVNIGLIPIPADAKTGSFINADVPVDSQTEWNGVFIKKVEKTDKPGPWIDTISVVKP